MLTIERRKLLKRKAIAEALVKERAEAYADEVLEANVKALEKAAEIKPKKIGVKAPIDYAALAARAVGGIRIPDMPRPIAAMLVDEEPALARNIAGLIDPALRAHGHPAQEVILPAREGDMTGRTDARVGRTQRWRTSDRQYQMGEKYRSPVPIPLADLTAVVTYVTTTMDWDDGDLEFVYKRYARGERAASRKWWGRTLEECVAGYGWVPTGVQVEVNGETYLQWESGF